jgi:hypothetical protein
MSSYGKKGWIKIVEAFIAILLITGVVLVISENMDTNSNNSEKVYEIETFVLREIELNDTLRGIVLNSEVPVEWEDFDSQLPEIKKEINLRIPDYIECEAKLCAIEDACEAESPVEKDIYSRTTTIFANLNIYNPRQLKLYCWEK